MVDSLAMTEQEIASLEAFLIESKPLYVRRKMMRILEERKRLLEELKEARKWLLADDVESPAIDPAGAAIAFAVAPLIPSPPAPAR